MMLKRLIQFTLILIAIFYAVDAHAGIIIRPVFHTGLVGYWDFQEGAGNMAYDKSGKDNDGTLTNMEESDWKNGKIGKALDFDGSNEYVSCGTDSSLNPATAITVAAWIKLGTWDGFWMAIAAKDQSAIAYWLGLRNVLGVPEFIISANGSTYTEAYGATALSDGVWYHVVGVYNGTDMRVYLNGALDINGANNPKSYSSGIYNSSGRLRISGSDGWANNEFNGIIDEVRVYNRALSESEIQRLYKLSQPTVLSAPRTGLVGYWPFEENTGTKAGDHSGYGNNGTWSGTGSHWTNGKLGKAGSFNGSDDYVAMGDINYEAGSFTYNAWIKTTYTAGRMEIITKYEGGAGDYLQFKLNENPDTGSYAANYIELIWGNSDWSQTDQVGGLYSSLFNGNWHMVTAIYDSPNGDMYIYVDGVQEFSDLNETVGGYSSSRLDRIGGDLANGQYFNGLIDEVRVYNRVLETSEIQALYKSGLAKINASQNQKLTDGLVGLWSFNGPDMDGDTAYDRSGQGNHGTLYGGPTRTIGKVGQALDFDGGNDYVTRTDANLSDNFPGKNATSTNSYSFAAWFKFNSLATDEIIMRKPSSWQVVGEGGDTIEWGLATNGGNTYLYTSTNLQSGTWYHIAGTWDGSYMRLYLNGALEDGPTARSNTLVANTQSFFMGGTGSSGYFDGILDEARIYNRALETSEIQRLYNLGR